ncbi:MAG: site-2 protease family protein [Tepidisphaeraceae bacterium]
MFEQLPSLILLVLGFGFVIFWHELGHFLAAKWVGIRVEQFAVGFGQALVSWRKGMGIQFGSSGRKYEELVQADREGIQKADLSRIGETEYRLNWIPLGGYVKMLGQDDLNPNAQQEDPHAYNKKSIGARMLVVSAGVIMNILLAAIGFMIVFRMGFRVQAPVIGSVLAHSPAANVTRLDGTPAPLQIGDRLLMYDGAWQHDFTKITLNVALSSQGKVPIYVRRVDGTEERLLVSPQRADGDPNGFLMIGIGPPQELRGLSPDAKLDEELAKEPDKSLFIPKQYQSVQSGDTITAINGAAVKPEEYWKLDRALQESGGKPLTLTIAGKDGKSREESVQPEFTLRFGLAPISFAGMTPRAVIESIKTNSSARGQLLPGDVILSMSFKNGDTIPNPTVSMVRSRLELAGRTSQPVSFRVLRGAEEKDVKDLVPNVKIDKGVYGLGVALAPDDRHPVVGETLAKSPAHDAGVPAGATLTAINGQPVANWFDVKRLLAAATPGAPVKVAATTSAGPIEKELKLTSEQIAEIAGLSYTHSLALHDFIEPRKTRSLAIAAAWGVTETRDFVLQFYLTIHRMFTGTVSYKNMMGPVGIFNAGRHFAYKGPDWLIWFLAMISANLAVVNFLPIPIVDGGLFTFLIVEKIQGKPLSAKTQSIAQVVGLAIILSVFLLVTYQDIARIAL